MKMKIIHVLCEGQTEQGFVENVLKPYLIENGVAAVKSVLVFTSRKENAFIPYIQLHEFEALVLCGLDFLKDLYKGRDKQIEHLKSDLEKVGNPELVNDKPETAPSKRIIKAVEGGKKKLYNYDKPKSGKFVTQKVGIEELRTQCRHFAEWIEKLLVE